MMFLTSSWKTEKKENNYQILKHWTQNPVQICYICNFFETYAKMRLTIYVLSYALSIAKDSESFKIISENILNTSFPPSWEKKSLFFDKKLAVLPTWRLSSPKHLFRTIERSLWTGYVAISPVCFFQLLTGSLSSRFGTSMHTRWSGCMPARCFVESLSLFGVCCMLFAHYIQLTLQWTLKSVFQFLV